MDLRNGDSVYGKRALLLLYPIDPTSSPESLRAKEQATREPLNAADDVLGMALVFPGNASTTVQNSYIAVDLSGVEILEDPDDTDTLIEEDSELSGDT